MKKFNWGLAKKTRSEEAYDYLYHVHSKNIQEIDFVRGYCSLPTEGGKPILSKTKAKRLYRNLKETYGFFGKDEDNEKI